MSEYPDPRADWVARAAERAPFDDRGEPRDLSTGFRNWVHAAGAEAGPVEPLPVVPVGTPADDPALRRQRLTDEIGAAQWAARTAREEEVARTVDAVARHMVAGPVAPFAPSRQLVQTADWPTVTPPAGQRVGRPEPPARPTPAPAPSAGRTVTVRTGGATAARRAQRHAQTRAAGISR